MAKTTYSEETGAAVVPVAPTKPVPIVDPSGQVVEVDGVNLEQAIAAGSRVATPEDVTAQKAAEYRALSTSEKLQRRGASPLAATVVGGLTDAFVPGDKSQAWREAGLEGATGGLGQVVTKEGIQLAQRAGVGDALKSFGLGALLDDKSADRYVKEVDRLREEYPTLRATGNAAGALAGAAISGGMGVGTIGGAAENLAGRGLARLGVQQGQGALARAGITALKAGIGGAAEGAVFGASQELSEEVLHGDPELNAQKILAAGGHGALYGGLLGGGIAGAGSLAASGIKAGIKAGVNALADHAGSIRGAADENVWKALDPTSAFNKKIARIEGGAETAGRVLHEEGVIGNSFGDAFRGGFAEEMHPKISAAKERVGKAIGEIHSTPATMSLGDVLATFEKKMTPLEGELGNKNVIRSVQELKEEMAGLLMQNVPPGTEAKSVADLYKTQIPIQDVIKQRKALDNLAFRESKALDPNTRVQLLREIRGELEDGIVKSIDDAATKAGNPEVAANLKDLKQRYQVLSVAEDAAEQSTSQYKANRNVSPSGQLWGAASMVASGSPLTGVVAAAGHQVLRTRGNAIASVALRRLADTADMMRAIQQTNAKLDLAAKGIVSGGEKATKALPAKTGTLKERFAAAVKDVENVRNNADQIAARVASQPAMAGAPKISSALAQNAIRGVTYLAARLPPTTAKPTLGGPDQPVRQSAEQMQAFVDAYDAVKDPHAALAQMSRGRVKREYATALKNTSPELFQELQRKTLEEVMRRQESGKPLSLNERLRLGIVLDIPTDPALEPSMMKALQSTISSATPESTGRPAPRRPSGTSQPVPENGIDAIEGT